MTQKRGDVLDKVAGAATHPGAVGRAVWTHLCPPAATCFHPLELDPEVVSDARGLFTSRGGSRGRKGREASPLSGHGLHHTWPHPKRPFLLKRCQFNVLDRGNQLPSPELVFTHRFLFGAHGDI